MLESGGDAADLFGRYLPIPEPYRRGGDGRNRHREGELGDEVRNARTPDARWTPRPILLEGDRLYARTPVITGVDPNERRVRGGISGSKSFVFYPTHERNVEHPLLLRSECAKVAAVCGTCATACRYGTPGVGAAPAVPISLG